MKPVEKAVIASVIAITGSYLWWVWDSRKRDIEFKVKLVDEMCIGTERIAMQHERGKDGDT